MFILEPDCVEDGGISSDLQDELTRLMTSHSSYRSAGQLLEVWTRQLRCLLPVNLIPVVFLHLHLTHQLTKAMKVK